MYSLSISVDFSNNGAPLRCLSIFFPPPFRVRQPVHAAQRPAAFNIPPPATMSRLSSAIVTPQVRINVLPFSLPSWQAQNSQPLEILVSKIPIPGKKRLFFFHAPDISAGGPPQPPGSN